MLKEFWEGLIDLVYPPRCPACSEYVDKHGQWCRKCLSEIVDARAINVTENELVSLDECFAVCEYTGGVKKLIHDMKFRQADQYAVHLAWLLERNVDHEFLRGVHLVVPVPLHASRLAERGFNQTELIFKGWATHAGLLWAPDVLIRAKATLPQWELVFSARQQNIRGAFTVPAPERVKGRHILLVDDIYTTGSTMDECARVLKAAGAARVTGLALASGAK